MCDINTHVSVPQATIHEATCNNRKETVATELFLLQLLQATKLPVYGGL